MSRPRPSIRLLAVVVWCLLVPSTASAIPFRSNDARCESARTIGGQGEICAELEAAKYNPTFHSDSTTCSSGAPCPACLSQDDVASFGIEEFSDLVGDVSSHRNVQVHLQTLNWLTAELLSTTFHILAKEVLNYDVRPYQSVNSIWPALCCDAPVIQLEAWPSTFVPSEEGFFSLSKLPIGYEGASGLFVKKSTVDKFPLSTAWTAYKFLEGYDRIFPKAFSTECQKLLSDTTKRCDDEANYFCAANEWTHTRCSQGRYVPPQCEGPRGENCQEIYMVMPTWDKGFFEGLIKNSGLNFTLAYVGTANHQELVSSAGDSFFYWWEPDPLVARLEAQAVNFPPSTAECRKAENADPTLNNADCGYPRSPLYKHALRSQLQQHPQLKFFFESFSFGSGEINRLLKEHRSGGGTKQVYDVSCQWVKKNYATWSNWMRRSTTDTSAAQSQDRLSTGALIGIVFACVVVFALVVGATVAAVVSTRRARKATVNAPTKAPLTLVITDVENGTKLWNTFDSTMTKSMELHNKIIREAIAEQQCYEVKVSGDSFLIACPTPWDATMMCMAVQRKLHAAEWPPVIENSPFTSTAEEELPADQVPFFRGLRVSMALHHCENIIARYDEFQQSYDYYGPDLAVVTKIHAVAKGGQLLIDSFTFHQLKGDESFDACQEENEFIRFASGVQLPGLTDPLVLYSTTPKALAGRRFPPIKGARMELSAENLGFASMHQDANDNCSNATSVNSGKTEPPLTFGIAGLFNSLSSVGERERLLTGALRHFRIETSATSYSRRLRALIKGIKAQYENAQKHRGDNLQNSQSRSFAIEDDRQSVNSCASAASNSSRSSTARRRYIRPQNRDAPINLIEGDEN